MTIKRNGYLYILIFVMVILISNLNSATASPLFTVSIEKEVTIKEESIYLGSIASIEGVSGQELEDIKSINLGQALLPGYAKPIYKSQIIIQLENNGFKREDFSLEMPDKVMVYTASKTITKDELIEKGKEYLYGIINTSAGYVEISSSYKPVDITIPDRDYRIECVAPDYINSPVGKVTVQANIMVGDTIYRKVFIGFRLKLYREVYVARRNIYQGEKIRSEDFDKELRTIDSVNGGIITNMDDPLVQDGVVKYQLSTGDILTSYYLEKPYIIKAGDEVQAEIVMGSIRVSTRVKAQQSGKKGDYITIENLKTGYKFQAQVISSHLVRLVK